VWIRVSIVQYCLAKFYYGKAGFYTMFENHECQDFTHGPSWVPDFYQGFSMGARHLPSIQHGCQAFTLGSAWEPGIYLGFSMGARHLPRVQHGSQAFYFVLHGCEIKLNTGNAMLPGYLYVPCNNEYF